MFFVKHISEVDFASIKLQEHVLDGIWITVHPINHWLIQHYYLVKKAVALTKLSASVGSWHSCNCYKHSNFRLLVSVTMVVFCCPEVLFKMSHTFTNKYAYMYFEWFLQWEWWGCCNGGSTDDKIQVMKFHVNTLL